MQVKRLLGPHLIDNNQALQNELIAVKDMYSCIKQQTDTLSQQHMFFHTTERILVSIKIWLMQSCTSDACASFLRLSHSNSSHCYDVSTGVQLGDGCNQTKCTSAKEYAWTYSNPQAKLASAGRKRPQVPVEQTICWQKQGQQPRVYS